jgi:hypothetical protein
MTWYRVHLWGVREVWIVPNSDVLSAHGAALKMFDLPTYHKAGGPGTIAKDFALSVCVCRGVANVHEGRVPDKSRGISGQSAL